MIRAGRRAAASRCPSRCSALLLGRFGLPQLPRGALAHIKYPVVIDAGAFRTATGFEHELDEETTIRAFCDRA